ncbi:MAG: hypothetical protein C5B60_09185, partial [Chloroflexi bacterium]
ATNQGDTLRVGSGLYDGTMFKPFLVVKSLDGNVGIDCSDPRGSLEVSTDTIQGFRGITTAQYYDGPHSAVLWMIKGRGTRATPAPVQIGDNLGTIVMDGVTNDGTIAAGASINTVVETVGAGTLSTYMTFATATGVEHMRITGAGNVGIGTSIPAYPLDVNGDVNISAGHVYRINGQPIGTGVSGNSIDLAISAASTLHLQPAGISGSQYPRMASLNPAGTPYTPLYIDGSPLYLNASTPAAPTIAGPLIWTMSAANALDATAGPNQIYVYWSGAQLGLRFKDAGGMSHLVLLTPS